nr:MAG TPA: hypothetical protein [Caudoviricetes sp.]
MERVNARKYKEFLKCRPNYRYTEKTVLVTALR